jgi:hypothetical protein
MHMCLRLLLGIVPLKHKRGVEGALLIGTLTHIEYTATFLLQITLDSSMT